MKKHCFEPNRHPYEHNHGTDPANQRVGSTASSDHKHALVPPIAVQMFLPISIDKMKRINEHKAGENEVYGLKQQKRNKTTNKHQQQNQHDNGGR